MSRFDLGEEETIMPILRPLSLLLGMVGVLAACGGESSSSAPASSATATTTVPATSVAASTQTATTSATGPGFESKLYHYALKSPDWMGTSAQTEWDGTGSPGDGDPTVDSLAGPEGERAFAFGEPTKTTLKKFVATSRKANAKVHPCPVNPQATKRITISDEPAVLDEMYCPAAGGPFVLTAFVIHAGQAHVFFTYEPPGTEAAMRDWFRSLLKTVSFGT